MRKLNINLTTLDEAGQRFIDAWKKAEQGKRVTRYCALSFESLEALLSTLTSKRWELLKMLRASGPMSVYALAKALGRDYKNVHGDVAELEEVGIITRTDDDRVGVPWDEIQAHMRLAA
jgi:predicted transcriptional regulator